MKAFNIYQYETPGGHFEAVKDGWSWPGLFFGWIWCFVKGFHALGAGLLIGSILFSIVARMDETVKIAFWAVELGIAVWLGSTGNRMCGEKLEKEGYVKVGTIESNSAENAVADYQANLPNVVSVTR